MKKTAPKLKLHLICSMLHKRGRVDGVQMSTDCPAPMTPADCDLRGLDYMPMFGNHLFGSEFNAAATDSEWRAAVTLWWAAWNQVPAGSLPDDDIALCRLADLGRDVKTWKKLRGRAMHGFVKCSDGRLYHEFLCDQAAVAWEKRIKERERKAKWRADQDAKRLGQTPYVPVTETGTETGTSAFRDATVPADGNGMDGNGRDTVFPDFPSVADVVGGAAQAPAPPPAFRGEANLKAIPKGAVVPLASDWELPADWGTDAEALGFTPPEILRESERFRQYWVSGKGAGARRAVKNWRQSWSNWLAKAEPQRRTP